MLLTQHHQKHGNVSSERTEHFQDSRETFMLLTQHHQKHGNVSVSVRVEEP